jgi:hypothetical protein
MDRLARIPGGDAAAPRLVRAKEARAPAPRHGTGPFLNRAHPVELGFGRCRLLHPGVTAPAYRLEVRQQVGAAEPTRHLVMGDEVVAGAAVAAPSPAGDHCGQDRPGGLCPGGAHRRPLKQPEGTVQRDLQSPAGSLPAGPRPAPARAPPRTRPRPPRWCPRSTSAGSFPPPRPRRRTETGRERHRGGPRSPPPAG